MARNFKSNPYPFTALPDPYAMQPCQPVSCYKSKKSTCNDEHHHHHHYPPNPNPGFRGAAAGSAFANPNDIVLSDFSTLAVDPASLFTIDASSVGQPLPLLQPGTLRAVELTQVNGYPDSLTPARTGLYSINYDVTVNRSSELSAATIEFAVTQLSANGTVTTLPNSFSISGATPLGISSVQNSSALATLQTGDSVFITVTSFNSPVSSLDSVVGLELSSLRIIEIP